MWSISNKNKFLIQRFLDAASGFFLSFFYIFGKRNKRIILNSTVNKDFTFNSKYLFINHKEEFENAGFEVKFVINDTEKRQALTKKYGSYFISTKGVKNKAYILSANCWVMSTMDPPISGLFMKYNRLVIQLGHGTPVKNIGLMDQSASKLKKLYYRLMSTNITYYLSPSEFFAEYIGKAFGVRQNQVLVARQPRLDSMSSGKSEFIESFRCNDKTKFILYSPTWRPYGDVQLFPFKDYEKSELEKMLEQKNAFIFLRLHPKFEVDLSGYLSSRVINLDSSKAEDITEHLNQFDALITDYSSIYCDFAMLDKPVGFIPYDLSEYLENVGFSHPYEELTWGTAITQQGELVKMHNKQDIKVANLLNISEDRKNISHLIINHF
ncbi:hypothetical protein C9I98_11350 [Photobacterium sanctipauli]|uniref:CDP-glycerol--glycerophosphate glycerophosphotransferase n=2 Tax=Photobacterium sanctipauli TaxID=1342794 RepID=A0A2T3NTD9_9GAMM|nr:CDP-glycerol glycerophosphotransferase family protein [Photobacterium sanctipauli]PSW19507.1 hypothetical protein C9I98_11350 [Photobacterium sanctipauli]